MLTVLLQRSVRSTVRLVQKVRYSSNVMPTIHVHPRKGLVDSDLSIEVKGLKRNQPVTLQVFLNESGLKFISCGQYIADNSGNVDVVKSASLGGTYEGVERHGLIWSMVQAPGQRQGLRLLKRVVTEPFLVHLLLHDGHIDVEKCYEQMESGLIARTTFSRLYLAEGVQRVPVRHGRLRGTLFIPAGAGPFPATIDLFGGVGGLVEFRAALLASHGIMAFHLAYFNYDDLQKNLSLIDLDYFEEAVDFLRSHPSTKGSKIGVVGVSKGAEIALMMSSFLPPHKLGAVVSINGFHYVYMTVGVYKGNRIAFDTCDITQLGITESGAFVFDNCIRKFEPSEESIIKVENATAKFLLISSESDGQIPPECSERVVERLKRFGNDNFEHLRFGEGVGHLIEPCHAPSFNESYQASIQVLLSWGGEKLPHARAQEIAWPRIKSFLIENLGENDVKSKL